jgi:hypothetical protein
MKKHLVYLGISIMGLFIFLVEIIAQSPTHIDTRRKEPNPFTLDDILLYIVFPALLFLAVLWARRYQKKKKEESDHQESRS